MKLSGIRERLETSNGNRARLGGESVLLDSLKANGADDNDTAQRVRRAAREAEDRVLQDVILNIKAVGWLNGEILEAAVRRAKVEQAADAMNLDDSRDALLATRNAAEAGLVELITLRTAMLRTVIASASALAPKDGHSVWGDIPAKEIFPDGPEIFGQPEASQAEVLTEEFDQARREAAKRGDSDMTDDELARMLGVY